MSTTHQHRWAISAIGSAVKHGAGTAPTATDAWTAALTVGRAALLTGDVDTLAVVIDGEIEALYDPGRDLADAAAITAALVEMHRSATAYLVADLLVGCEGQADRMASPRRPTLRRRGFCARVGCRRPAWVGEEHDR